MTGTAISDMNPEATLPDGAIVPFVVPDSSSGLSPSENYIYDLGADLLTRVTYPALAQDSGAALVGADDNASGSLWTTVSGFISYLLSSTGSAVVGFLQAGAEARTRTLQDKTREIVSVTDYDNCDPTGTTDSTSAFQAAHDAHPDGVTIRVPPGIYLVDRVDITNRNVTVLLDCAATLKRTGTPSTTNRAMFRVEFLPEANFSIVGEKGSVIDLNGEGPIGIGVAGRYTNLYRSQTVPGVIAIAGPNNAALYGLESTHITVRGVLIKNTGESGVVFRNCANTVVDNCDFENVANVGVEVTYTDPANYGSDGSGNPDGHNHVVRNCTFTDIDDFGRGTGNGCGVLVGGSSMVDGYAANFEITGCTFTRCLRDVHFEASIPGEYFDNVRLAGGQSVEAGQGSVGLVGARGSVSDWHILNAGGAAAAGGYSAGVYGDIYGIVVSGGGAARVNINNISVVDNRNTKTYRGTDGVTTAGDATFTSASASFSASDIGREICIVDAGPQSTSPGIDPGYAPHITRIASINSATSVELVRAPSRSLTGATYTYGGGTREGIRIFDAVSAFVSDARIEAGIASGLPSEPAAAAITVYSATSEVVVESASLIAPSTPGTTPAGLRLSQAIAGKLTRKNVSSTGFTENFKGIDIYRASVRGPLKQTANGVTIAPSNTVNTDGTETIITPNGTCFSAVLAGALTFTLSAETLTVTISAYRYDGLGPNTATITSNTNGQVIYLNGTDLWNLNQDNAPLRQLGIKVKSSVGGHAASANVAYKLTALEG